ncbi:hypothetical protein OKW22_000247 [Bacilli bacterium PM5-3]|nr:hypothetical protein [Bacilli bacterium PM5-3]MDH6603336.1 hypothetical protein [Bacilli bacterium PM5-9]
MKKITLFLLLLLVCVGCGSKKEVIELDKYVTVTWSGVNGAAKIGTVNVDDEKLVSDYPNIKDYWDTEYVYDIVGDDIDKDGSLSNGDKIKIDFDIVESDEINKLYDIDTMVTLKVEGLSDAIGANQAFSFGNLELTLSDKVTITKVNNPYDENHNKKVVKMPVKVKNTSDSKERLNIFNYEVYGPKQDTKLNTVSALFLFTDNKSLDFGSDILPGKTVKRNMYFLYEGKGVYTFYFDDYIEKVEAQVDIKK